MPRCLGQLRFYLSGHVQWAYENARRRDHSEGGRYESKGGGRYLLLRICEASALVRSRFVVSYRHGVPDGRRHLGSKLRGCTARGRRPFKESGQLPACECELTSRNGLGFRVLCRVADGPRHFRKGIGHAAHHLSGCVVLCSRLGCMSSSCVHCAAGDNSLRRKSRSRCCWTRSWRSPWRLRRAR